MAAGGAAATTGTFSSVTYGDQSFLIMEQPKESTLPTYLRTFADKNVEHVVRVCDEKTYDTDTIEAQHALKCHAFPYPDGLNPGDDVIEPWLALCAANGEENKKRAKNKEALSTIAVHCVAGLGRAPVLVAIALIEEGCDPIEAVEKIRKARTHAINKPQMKFLTDTDSGYKRRKGGAGGCNCTLL